MLLVFCYKIAKEIAIHQDEYVGGLLTQGKGSSQFFNLSTPDRGVIFMNSLKITNLHSYMPDKVGHLDITLICS